MDTANVTASMDAETVATMATRKQRVWDVPTRIMHWLLVALLGVCWWTGIHDQLDYHLYSGYGVLWIALMRLYWGFFGSSTARFTHFVRGPVGILNYARTLHHRDTAHSYGHNPVGAISVLLMLAAVLAVVGLGLFAVDVDGLYSGPLSSYVTFKGGRHLAHLHYQWFEYLLAIIGLHLVAVAFYYVYKRQNLVAPMISGSRTVAEAADEELEHAPLWRFVAGAVIVSGFVWAVSIGFYF
jgi:cytochrome b